MGSFVISFERGFVLCVSRSWDSEFGTYRVQGLSLRLDLYLEGQGDLVSGLIIWITGVTIWVTYLLIPPDPPSNVQSCQFRARDLECRS